MTQPTVYIVMGGDAAVEPSALAFDEGGEILETVEWADGKPIWTDAGICDSRGAGGDLGIQQINMALMCMEANAREVGFEIVRVPEERGGRIVKVIWKDEGGAGPISLLSQEDLDARVTGRIGRPYDPNRTPPKWYTREEAERMATELSAEFDEA